MNTLFGQDRAEISDVCPLSSITSIQFRSMAIRQKSAPLSQQVCHF